MPEGASFCSRKNVQMFKNIKFIKNKSDHGRRGVSVLSKNITRVCLPTRVLVQTGVVAGHHVYGIPRSIFCDNFENGNCHQIRTYIPIDISLVN